MCDTRPGPAQSQTCHACHAKPGPCRQVPRLPRKTKVNVNVTKCQTCHGQQRSTSPNATPARQNASQCRQVPNLPRKMLRRPGRPSEPKRATRPCPVPYVPRLPCKTVVGVAKCHACHAKPGRPADPSRPQDPAQSGVTKRCERWCVKESVTKMVCERECDKDGV